MLGSAPLLLAALSACSPTKDSHETGQTAETGHTGETGGDSTGDSSHETGDSSGETGDSAVASLYGTEPEEAVSLPDFSATNRDGSPRGPSDLTGHPTALWFYPAAFTGG